jgi:arylsulfatase A-like enzyme
MTTKEQSRQAGKNTALKIIIITVSLLVLFVLFYFFILPGVQSTRPLLAELPRAYLLYDGLTINMDGSPDEVFWLSQGFGPTTDIASAPDGKGRIVVQTFDLILERWQARNISLELGINMEPGAQGLTFLVNGKEVSTKATSPGYQVLTFLIPDEDLKPGNNTVTLQVNGDTVNTILDYVRWHLGKSDAVVKPEVDQRLIDGKEVSVIGSAEPYEINYYLAAPRQSHLQLTIGHDGEVSQARGNRFRIWYRGYSSGEKLLWEGEYPTKGTKELDLPLNNFDDEILLLSFYSDPNPKVTDWFYMATPQLVYPTKPPAPELERQPLVMENKSPRTIVLIVEDAMRKDMLSVYGNTIVETPNLDKIAKSGLVFDNCYAPSNWTHPSFCAMFTSLPFTKNGANGKLAVMVEDVPTLAGILNRNNWETAFFTTNPITSSMSGVPRDFKHVSTHFIRHGKYTIEDYIPWLKDYLEGVSTKNDAFIVLHLMDTHHPINIPPQYNEKYRKIYAQIKTLMPWLDNKDIGYKVDEEEWVFPIYAVENYVDDMLPKVLDTIGQYRDLKNTMYFFLSDHGEEMYDHGGVDHGHTMYEELLHIPMIVWGAGVVPGRCSQYIDGTDLMPTILDLAGIQTPTGLDGISFANKLNGDETIWPRPIFSAMRRDQDFMTCAISSPWKIIYSEKPPALYNLMGDPKETSNQIKSNPIMFGYMRGILHEWLMGIFAQGMRESQHKLTYAERDLEILKGLGYMQ